MCIYLFAYLFIYFCPGGRLLAKGLFHIGWIMGSSHKVLPCLNLFWKAAIPEVEGIPPIGHTLPRFSGFI